MKRAKLCDKAETLKKDFKNFVCLRHSSITKYLNSVYLSFKKFNNIMLKFIFVALYIKIRNESAALMAIFYFL